MIVYSYQKLGLCSILSLPTYIEREKERRKKRSGSGSQSRSEKHRSWSKDRGNRSREKRSRSRDRKSREQRSTSRDHKKHRWVFSPWYSTEPLTDRKQHVRYTKVLPFQCYLCQQWANMYSVYSAILHEEQGGKGPADTGMCLPLALNTSHHCSTKLCKVSVSFSLPVKWLISHCNVPLFYLFPVKFIHVRINCQEQCQLPRLCEVSLTLHFSLQRLGRYPQ